MQQTDQIIQSMSFVYSGNEISKIVRWPEFLLTEGGSQVRDFTYEGGSRLTMVGSWY